MISGLFYILLGCLFAYLAINSGDDNIWGIRTLLPALIATYDFGIGIRLLRVSFYMRKNQDK